MMTMMEQGIVTLQLNEYDMVEKKGRTVVHGPGGLR